MQTEELKQAIEGPVTELQADSKESKSNHVYSFGDFPLFAMLVNGACRFTVGSSATFDKVNVHTTRHQHGQFTDNGLVSHRGGRKWLKIWSAQGDDFRTFLSELVSALPQTEISIYATPVRR